MFGPRYFAPRYFAPRYWPPGLGLVITVPGHIASTLSSKTLTAVISPAMRMAALVTVDGVMAATVDISAAESAIITLLQPPSATLVITGQTSSTLAITEIAASVDVVYVSSTAMVQLLAAAPQGVPIEATITVVQIDD